MARAVEDAHRKGYLHRDLKPTNILVDAQGKPHLTDFLLALRVGRDSNLTQPGVILGTPKILYELLTGRTPCHAGSVLETLVLVLEADPVPPGRLRPGVPRALEAICLKCLEKSPLDRYPSAAALAEDLERFVLGDEVQACGSGSAWSGRRPPSPNSAPSSSSATPGRGTIGRHDHHPNIVVAGIAVAGFIVVIQVERLLALNSFYGNRSPD